MILAQKFKLQINNGNSNFIEENLDFRSVCIQIEIHEKWRAIGK